MSDIFSDVQTNDVAPEVQNAYEVLVGEGKKFRDPEALAKAKLQSDNFILQLQRENAELREKAQRAASLEEIKTQILSGIKQEPSVVPPAQQPVEQPQPPTNLEEIVNKALETKEAQRKAQTNREVVTQAMKEKFGADAQIILNEKAGELGLSLDYLAKVANDSPAAFFRLIGVDTNRTPAPNSPAPRSSTYVAPDQRNVERTQSWYANEKKKVSDRAALKRLQDQEMADAMRLGEKFFD